MANAFSPSKVKRIKATPKGKRTKKDQTYLDKYNRGVNAFRKLFK